MNKPSIFKNTTPKELFLITHAHFQNATPEFLRGLQGAFDKAIDSTTRGDLFVEGVEFALGPSAGLAVGARLGLNLASPDGWMHVAPAWVKEYRESKKSIAPVL